MGVFLSAALAAFIMPTFTNGANKPDREMLFSGLGAHRRTVSTSSSAAQRYFSQGLSFLYAFNHDEASRAFRAATQLDPNCGMAYWGIALSTGPHINNPYLSPADAARAVSALKKARALSAKLTPVERALVDAASTRYRSPQPSDRSGLDRAYADAMRRVWRRFPKDADVGALFAESMMDLRPWNLWKRSGEPQPGTLEVTRTLGEVMKLDGYHPLALHLTIHAWEASPTPERADIAANRLRLLQPGLGHMVHMPSHIDVLRGRWKESILANERAIRTDDAYRRKRPRQGFYRIYMAHNRHMLGFSAMMVGQRKKTLRAMDEMVAGMPTEWVRQMGAPVEPFVIMPLEARVRFGRWDEVLAWPEYPEWMPLCRALRHAARGVAFAAKGRVVEAEAEAMLFADTRTRVAKDAPVGNSSAQVVLTLVQHMLSGEILLAKGDTDAAIGELRLAVQAENQLGYDEPPDWIIPTRHILGVALLKANRPAEAEAIYRQDLKRLPNNGWSLYGLSESLQRQGKLTAASSARAQFQAIWKGADTPITSSCMCVPHG